MESTDSSAGDSSLHSAMVELRMLVEEDSRPAVVDSAVEAGRILHCNPRLDIPT